MKPIITLVLVTLTYYSTAQNFSKKFSTPTPFTLIKPQLQWVDANNDSLLDVIIANSVKNEIKFHLFKNFGNDSLGLAQVISSGYQSGKFFLTDFDHDNKIDIAFSGMDISGNSGTVVFMNQGKFGFQKNTNQLLNVAFVDFVFSDLNNDGAKDLIGSDNNKLYIYKRTGSQFILKKDTSIQAQSLKSFDLDENCFQDIIISGKNAAGQPTSFALLMEDQFNVLRTIEIESINGKTDAGDLNSDGLFDLTISGKNSNALVTGTFINDTSKFSLVNSTLGLDTAYLKIADFNSDGKADIDYFGNNTNSELKNWIKTSADDSTLLPTTALSLQDFGDYDRDGDLDLVQLRSDSIVLLNNHPDSVNVGPIPVINIIALPIYDRMFFYWPKTVDDHTDSTSITYDLIVFDHGLDAISGEYDLHTQKRLLVSHGNLETANYSLVRIDSASAFGIQSIDNSFTTLNSFFGVCHGGQYGPGGKCEIKTETITLCDTTKLVYLKPVEPQAMWFSFSKGFLGIHDSLTHHFNDRDTIFSFNRSKIPSCSNLKLFKIKTNPTDTVKITRNLWNCKDSQNILTVDAEWMNVIWKNNLNSSTQSGDTIKYQLQKNAVLIATGNNDNGCHLKETYNLKISFPELVLESTQYQISKGSSVTLNASGAQHYAWSPSSSLNNDTIASPIATPSSTTNYTVIGRDSLGCSASANVLVEVRELGFIPTLFTPNGDGKNDELKVYGITSVNNFKFIIYNREGSILFETSDVATATQQGWTGTTNGHPQPPGTYYWKVEGNDDFGGTTLNGKKSGVFLLVR